MQDFHSIPGLADRIFGGGGGGGGGAENRRMRGYPGGCIGAQEPPAKCPRCESTNTKFCYYNNYNLSQPRHFCKSCRRYWTKGGVLRSVPVGGGCRKSSSSSSNSKRSSPSPSKKQSSKDRRRSPTAASHSRSSSDSSSLTAAAAEASASASASTSASGAASASPFFADPSLFAQHNPHRITDFDPDEMEPPAMIPGSGIFCETGTFTSLMPAAGAAPSAFLGLNFSDPLPPPPPPLQFGVHQPLHHRNGTACNSFETDHEIRMQGLTSGRIDQTLPIDLPPPAQQQDQFDGRMCGGAACGIEWPTAAEQLLFDFGVDPGAYWNQSQWSDADPSSLYLP